MNKDICSILKTKIKEQKEFQPNLFDNLLVQVKFNLFDTYNRFSKLPEYRKFVANQIAANELYKTIDSDGIIETVRRKSIKLTEQLSFASNSEIDGAMIEALKRKSQKVAENAIEKINKAIECKKE